jgi:hypothetical protein
MKIAYALIAALAACAGERRPVDYPPQDPAAREPAPAGPFTETFHVDAAEWSTRGTNPYFMLEPGTVAVLEGKEDGEDTKLTISVLDETRRVAGVETRVVEEREEQGGELSEVSRNFFAISKRTNDVYYFGEEVDEYEDGKLTKHSGAWLAGENRARFGLLMPGSPLIGARYYQELAPGVAMDRAEVVALDAVAHTPLGDFDDCLKTVESSAVEKGRETKLYAFGIGLVGEESLRLTKFVPGKK